VQGIAEQIDEHLQKLAGIRSLDDRLRGLDERLRQLAVERGPLLEKAP